MSPGQLYDRVILGVVALCHGFAGIQFWLKRPELEAPPKWTQQFYILLGLSLCLSLLLFVYRHADPGRIASLTVKFLVFLLIGYAGGKYVGIEFTLLTALIIEISAYFPLVRSLVITVAVIAITLLAQRPVEAWDVNLSAASPHDMLSLGGYACVIAVFAHLLRALLRQIDAQTQTITRLDTAVLRVMSANVGFQEYAATATEQSAARERQRISRDIHDTAVHTFITIIMLAETAVDVIGDKNAKVLNILQQLITQAKEGVRDTRQALRELRAMEAPASVDLKAIYHLAHVFEEVTGVRVHVDFGNLPWSFNKELDQALYRMIQEGLTNAFRHGKATLISIRLWIFESELIARIHDNGKGTAIIKKGIGLQGMDERLQKFHGRIEAKNLPDGFEIVARIPLEDEKDDGKNTTHSG